MKHKVGDDIYVPTSFYISHGEDDFVGGLCKIKSIVDDGKDGINSIMITIEERPGCNYNYKSLLEDQEKLQKEFGTSRGYQDPDYGGSPYWLEPGDIVDGEIYTGEPIL